MKLISRCHFDDKYGKLLRVIETTYDAQKEEGIESSLHDSGPVEWLAAIWTLDNELQGLLYDLWNAQKEGDIEFAKTKASQKAQEAVILMLNLIQSIESITE